MDRDLEGRQEPGQRGEEDRAEAIQSVDTYPIDESAGDLALELIEAGASVLPVVPNLIASLVTPPLEKRRTKWFQNVEKMLNNHSQTLAELTEERKDEFVTLFLRLSEEALRTHQTERVGVLLDALRGALVSPADFDLKLFYVALLDDLQPLHVKLLSYFADPAPLLRRHYGDSARPIDMPELLLLEQPAMSDAIQLSLAHLRSRGLISDESQQTTEKIEVKGSLTSTAREFLNFLQATGDEGEK